MEMLGAGLHRKASASPDARGKQEASLHRSGPATSQSSARRGSEGNPISTISASNITSTASGWARRLASDSLTTERERSQLLRTISHLNKEETPDKPSADTTDVGATTTHPFTRFDLLPPPEYRARQQRKSLDMRRARGMSLSEDRREEEAPHGSTNASQLSIPLVPSTLASQGRIRAAAAAAKLRRLSVSQLSSRKFADAVPSPASCLALNGGDQGGRLDPGASCPPPPATTASSSDPHQGFSEVGVSRPRRPSEASGESRPSAHGSFPFVSPPLGPKGACKNRHRETDEIC